jgi:hypothetical protein
VEGVRQSQKGQVWIPQVAGQEVLRGQDLREGRQVVVMRRI